jgi:hypothetical protein
MNNYFLLIPSPIEVGVFEYGQWIKTTGGPPLTKKQNRSRWGAKEKRDAPGAEETSDKKLGQLPPIPIPIPIPIPCVTLRCLFQFRQSIVSE